MRKSDLRVAAVTLMFVFMIVALMIFDTQLGLPADIEMDFIQLFPGLLGIVIGLGLTTYTRGLFALPALFLVGVAFAHLSSTMWDMGLINTLMLTGLTIGELQIWIIIISTLLGGIITALTWRR